MKQYSKPLVHKYTITISQSYILVDGLLMYRCKTIQAVVKRLNYKQGIMDEGIIGWV